MKSKNEEYRISLIHFKGDTVEISNYWVDEAKYAVLRAALGEPQVDSIYDRKSFSRDKVLPEGVHYLPE